MRIHFLGTGPSEPIPRPGHQDAACSDARKGGKSRRSRSCAIVSHHGTSVLIDAGPDIISQLTQAGWPKIDAILLTHAHRDAVGGIKLLAQRWRRFRYRRIPVFARKATIARIADPMLDGAFELHALRGASPVPVNGMRIVPFPVVHVDDPRFPTDGFLFGYHLAYASDIGRLPKRIVALLSGVQTIVLDGAYWFGLRFSNHLAPDQAIDYARASKARRLILTQIGHSYPPHDQAQKQVRTYLRSLHRAFPERVDLAWDHWTVRL